MASTAVQLFLFDVTPPAQHAAQGPYGGSLPELRQQRQGGPPGSEAPGRSVAGLNACASKLAPQAVVDDFKCPYGKCFTDPTVCLFFLVKCF